jgi:hypothetical protein
MEDALMAELGVDFAKARHGALAVWKALEGSGHQIIAGVPGGFELVLKRKVSADG